ncbi:MAG: OmpP1/FadL family transporter [Phormidesmis sp.]
MSFSFGFPTLALATGLSLLSAPALASGFALTEQSVSNLGAAGSAGAAGLDDISTIHWNPAGLMRLPEENGVSGAGYIIFSNINFKNEGSFVVPGLQATGSDGGNAGVTSFIPNLYGAYSLSDRARIGIGITTPFGLATEYNSDWVGRYQAIKSELVTININPTAAYQVSNNFAVGAGVSLQYAEAELTNAIDFGGILASRGAPVLPQSADGAVNISGSDWSVGFNLGLLYEPTETTRVGLTYRSPVNHTLRGDADFSVPALATPLTATGQFTDTSATADLNLPDTIALGVHQEITPQLDLTADLTWTNWSDFRELRVDFDSPQPDSVVPENWNDTIRVAMGLTYEIDDAWKVRGGVAYDPTPAPQAFMTARIPDSDRTWVALGVSYEPTDNLSLDLAYTHIFVAGRRINNAEPGTGTLIGSYDNSVDIVGAQVNWRF